jgi:hypothetical protein
MNEQQPIAAPTPSDFFEICLQMLTAAQVLHETTVMQSEEIRHLIAEWKAQRK